MSQIDNNTISIVTKTTNNIDINIFFHIPDDYPYSQPRVCFEKKIFHPNISSDGGMCTGGGMWLMSMTLESELEKVLSLLELPNTSEPTNIKAAELYNQNPSQYTAVFTESMK